MKIALIGATGFVGSKILPEALSRKHQVTAIARNTAPLKPQPNLTVKACDVHDVDALCKLLAGHDVVISAFNPARQTPGPEVYHKHVAGHRAIIDAVKKSGVKRYIAVGGAASLKVKSGQELLDSAEFPKEYEQFKGGIRGTREQYYMLKNEPSLDWVFLAPSVRLLPGTRTGKYRAGKDEVLYDAKGESHISLEDYAVAVLDEIEKPKHTRERFTVGY